MTEENSGNVGADIESSADGYAGSDSFFSDLGDTFMDSVDSIELGEDGSLDMRIHEPASETEAPEGADPESSAITSEQPASGQSRDDAEFLEGQYREVQGWATRVSQENAELKAQMAELMNRMDQGSPSSADDAGSELDLDPEVVSQLDAYMERNLGNVLSHKLGVPVDELGELLHEASLNRELRSAYAKYEDFDAKMPAMIEISTKYPNLNYDQLYDLATTFGGQAQPAPGQTEGVVAPGSVQPQTPTQSSAPPPSHPQTSQADLVARAQQVSTLQGSSAEEGFTPERTIKSPRDAMLAALEEEG